MKKRNLTLLTILILGIILTNISCEKLEIKRITKIKTGEIEEINYNTATAQGLIIDVGDGLKEIGHCWDTIPEPDVNSNKLAMQDNISQGAGIHTEMTELIPGQTYHVRAYAITAEKTIYGTEISFETAIPDYSIAVVSPIQSDAWAKRSTQVAEWSSNAVGEYNLELWKATPSTKVVDMGTSDGAKSFAFTMPDNLDPGYYQIRVSSINYPSIFAFSESFEVLDNFLEITKPNNSTTFQNGKSAYIEWNTDFSNNFQVYLVQEGSSEEYIGGTFGNSITWTPVGFSSGTNYRIKVVADVDQNGKLASDLSDEFTITDNPFINITAPTSAVEWQAGNTYDITWDDNLAESVRIELFKNGNPETEIANNIASTSPYSWTLPTNLVAGSDYSIKITNVNNASITDESEQFTILVAPTGLVAYYPFTGNANDESGNNFNGTVNGATLTSDRFGNTNSAYSFDGTNDWINIGSEPGNGIRTISLWFNPGVTIDSNVPDALSLIARNSANEEGEFGLYFTRYDWTPAGALGFGRTTSSTGFGIYSDNNLWQANNWVHVTGVIDPADGMKLYINGVLQTSTDASTAPTDVRSEIVAIGQWGDSNNSGRFFDGKIDDIRIYDYALSTTEIQNLYTENGWQGYETGTVIDKDNNTYQTVKIGNQWWMAENLKVTQYESGTAIPLVTDNTEWANLGDNDTDKAYCYYNNNTGGEAATYGALYTYAAAMNGVASSTANPSGIQGVCPTGWHLPSDAEWKELEIYLGMSQSEADNTGWRGTNEGSKLAGNAALWTDGALDSNAEFGTSGFYALPSGYRFHNDGLFYYIGNYGYWWSATEDTGTSTWRHELYYNDTGVGKYYSSKSYGFSVRCVKNQ